jgi:hypothetical protein
MPRNKIKQDFNFTTLKGSKIIKLTTCDRFYNLKKSCTFYGVWLFFSSLYRVNICLLWENIECFPLLVTSVNKKKLPPFDQRQITFLQVFIAVVVAYIQYIDKIHCILLWNTFKILPRHECISINRQFNSTMENNFAGIRTCSTGTCFIQKIYAPFSSLLQGKHLPFTPSPLRLNIFRLCVILSLTQLYRYTPEIFLFSTATFKYIYRVPLRRIGQEYPAKVAWWKFKSLKRIQPLPVCAGFFICIRSSLDRPCVTMPSW